MPDTPLAPFGDQAIDAILDVFMLELPQTSRMMNSGALVVEVMFGKDASPEEDELPDESVYSYFAGLLEGLHAQGILQLHEDHEWQEEDRKTGETEPIKVYALSREAMLVYKAVRRAPLITTVPELVDQYAEGKLCPAAADTIAHLISQRQLED